MKTCGVRYEKNGGVKLVELDIPDPHDDEVQIEVSACGICSWDISTYQHGTNGPLPAPGGHEGIGYVFKVGRNVENFREGDRVVGGAFQRYYNRAARKVYRLPKDELDDRYWLVEPVTCIVTGLDHAAIRPGKRVAVVGCGFMGMMFLQALRHSLAVEVIAVTNRQERACMAAQCGAAKVVVAHPNRIDDAVEQLRTNHIDVVIDCTGTESGLHLSTNILRAGGRLVLFGWIKESVRLPANEWHLGGFTVVNASPWSKIRDPYPPAIELMGRRIIDLQPLVTHTVPLVEYPNLLEQIAIKSIDYVKGVVTLG
jgi:threonine dehydrogenase-like Zn-dependent dehydrogenase